ncbi:MAG: tetratricopeptide repeat protein [Bacteroidales bacterium]
MNTITKYFLIFIFLSVAFSIKSEAQKEDSHLDIADEYFSTKKYLKASIEYERVLYNNNNDPNLSNTAHYKKALCYRFLKRNEDALSELERISLFHADDTFKNKIHYEKSFNLLLLDKPKEALLQINQINVNSLPSNSAKNIIPLKILVLNKSREWDKAEKTFSGWINSLNLTQEEKKQWIDTLKTIYTEKNLPKDYSAEKAHNLSRFIPGAGQIYTGHIWEGAGSFIFNAAAIGAGIHQVWNGFYFTGYIGGFGIFYKSYFGGMERASNLAKKKKDIEMTEFNNDCAKIISQILDGDNSFE